MIIYFQLSEILKLAEELEDEDQKLASESWRLAVQHIQALWGKTSTLTTARKVCTVTTGLPLHDNTLTHSYSFICTGLPLHDNTLTHSYSFICTGLPVQDMKTHSRTHTHTLILFDLTLIILCLITSLCKKKCINVFHFLNWQLILENFHYTTSK